MSACVVCNKPLEVEFERDDEEHETGASSSSGKAPAAAPEMVPDDVQMSCGCHFHWSVNHYWPAAILILPLRDCLLEAYETAECSNCGKNISSTSSTGAQQVLCNLNNEGGLQKDLDILPLLHEESYLKAYPEDRKSRAFLEFCREGDYKAIVGMLQDDEVDEDENDDEDEEMADNDQPGKEVGIDRMLRYQDPIGDMQSGLHAAVHAQSREVAWLLLLLASNYDLLEFPPQVYQEAEAMGIMRGLTEDKVDIRSLRDANGKTAEDIAREVGGVWVGWTDNGRLAI
jgi:hypothetical protein